MLYFNTLPKVITPDQNGNYILMTNILTRATLIEELQNNPMLFYTYNIQDGDTPEIIAEKYYNETYNPAPYQHKANEFKDNDRIEINPITGDVKIITNEEN